MKRVVIAGLVLSLIAGAFAMPATAAKKKKKKKPTVTQVDQTYYMRRATCGADDDMTRLSTLDDADASCWYFDAGILYELIERAAQNGAPFNSSVLWEPYPAEDGVPFVLDTAKPITGEITLYGGDCVQEPACSPAGIAAGQATFRVRFVATIAGEDKELGVYEDTFMATPGSTHTSQVELAVDPEFQGALLEGLRIEVFRGGIAYGPGGIEYEDPASFITVPTLVTQ